MAKDISEVNKVLGINLWDVRSFRAVVEIDFDEYGNILKVTLVNKYEGRRSGHG